MAIQKLMPEYQGKMRRPSSVASLHMVSIIALIYLIEYIVWLYVQYNK